MKITIYTVSDCKFSQEEKTYLQSKGIQFEEKNLETNRDFLTEMLQKSNNFAGTPVTEIVKDDGTTQIVKGFTQTEFDTALGLSSTAATPAQDPSQQSPAEQPEDAPIPPVSDPTPEPITQPVMPTPPVQEPMMPQTSEAASAMSIPDPVGNAQPVVDSAQPTTNPEPAPAMPDVLSGQILSDNLSAPVTTPSMTPGAGQTFSAAPPAPQGGPVADPTAGIGANPNIGMPTEPTAMPQAPAQATPPAENPLNSVLSDLQSKANS